MIGEAVDGNYADRAVEAARYRAPGPIVQLVLGFSELDSGLQHIRPGVPGLQVH
jgi:hypothetical protein